MLAAALVLTGAAVAFVAWQAQQRFVSPGPLPEERAVIVPRGSGVDGIARLLEEQGVIEDALLFKIGVKLTGEAGRLRAGEFAFPAHVSPRGAMQILTEGQTVVHRLTVPEGLTVRQVIELLRQNEALSGEISSEIPEGSLLPETYHFTRGDSRESVIQRMRDAMTRTLDELWESRQPDLPLRSKEEAVILASVVERETSIAAERPRVAGVFINRLRRGMPLQSDPTVIYGMSEGLGVIDRPLTRRDLTVHHEWNTYTIPALPATPIANPGRASLQAVLNPAKTRDLFFVADGTGGHAFAETLEQHNRNVARWRRIQRGEQ